MIANGPFPFHVEKVQLPASRFRDLRHLLEALDVACGKCMGSRVQLLQSTYDFCAGPGRSNTTDYKAWSGMLARIARQPTAHTVSPGVVLYRHNQWGFANTCVGPNQSSSRLNGLIKLTYEQGIKLVK